MLAFLTLLVSLEDSDRDLQRYACSSFLFVQDEDTTVGFEVVFDIETS